MQTLKEWQALKEWAVVVNALEEGKQCILFRKGGILDAGFSVESEEFLLFPTFEHQTKQYLKDSYKTKFDELISHREENDVTITSAAKVAAAFETSDKKKLLALRDHHVYNDEFIDYRMQWNQDKPMNVVIVRAYPLKEKVTISMKPEYSGCRSWIKVNAPTELAAPILSDREFNSVRREIEGILA